jgi:hypothetical protein
MKTVKQIAEQNDQLRKTGKGGRMNISGSLSGNGNLDAVLAAMRAFNSFDMDNDPYGQHDCGIFEVDGEKYMFKIDYYDANLEYGVDPLTEPAVHVLTLMHASDY